MPVISNYRPTEVDVEGSRMKVGIEDDGHDIKKMIKTFDEANKANIKPYEDHIKVNDEFLKKLEQKDGLRDKYEDLKNKAAVFRNYLSVASDELKNNVFSQRFLTGLTNDGVPINQYINIHAPANSEIRPINVQVNQLAKSDVITSTSTFVDPKAALNLNTNALTVNGIQINIDPTSSASNLIKTLNSYANQTNVIFDYAIVDTTANTFVFNAVSRQLSEPINFNQATITALKMPINATSSDNLMSKVTINGTQFVRQGNSGLTGFFSDPNATVDLVAPMTSAAQGQINYNRAGIIDALQDYITAQNAFYQEKDVLKEYLNEEIKKIPAKNADLRTNLISSTHYLEKLEAKMNNYLSGFVKGLDVINSLGAFRNVGSSSAQGFNITSIPTRLQSSISSQPITLSYQKDANGNTSATFTSQGVVYNATIDQNVISFPQGYALTGLSVSIDSTTASNLANNNALQTTITLNPAANNASLSAFGLVFDGSEVSLDSETLSKQLSNNLEGMVAAFGDSGKSTDTKFSVFGIPSKLKETYAGVPIILTYTKDNQAAVTASFSALGKTYAADIIGTNKNVISMPDNIDLSGLWVKLDDLTAQNLVNGSSISTTIYLTQGQFSKMFDTFQDDLMGKEAPKISQKGEFEREIFRLKQEQIALEKKIEQKKERADVEKELFQKELMPLHDILSQGRAIHHLLEGMYAYDMKGK